jgi:protein-disulfide isomerase
VVKNQRRAGSRRPFYIALGVISLAGAGALAWQVTRPRTAAQIAANVTPVQAEGYLYGNPNAPVQILEFADFECPSCANFTAVTEPDVRKRIVDAGLASFRFYDYPLTSIHKNTILAHMAAACAADQEKFWEMHDRILLGQMDWAAAVGEAEWKARRRANGVLERYARDVGLNTDEWERCYKEQRHLGRILANRAEGERRGVNSTPTFVIGRRLMPGGRLGFDQIRAYVDTARAEAERAGSAGGAAGAPVPDTNTSGGSRRQ